VNNLTVCRGNLEGISVDDVTMPDFLRNKFSGCQNRFVNSLLQSFELRTVRIFLQGVMSLNIEKVSCHSGHLTGVWGHSPIKAVSA